MIRKFATMLALAVLVAPCIRAQQTPDNQQSSDQQQSSSGQQPNAQQPSSGQQPPEEEPTPRRSRTITYQKWQFNLDGGVNLPNGTTQTFVKGGGFSGGGGVAHNASPIFGLRLDFSWSQLPLRSSALELAQAPSASSHVYGLNLDPIINIPATKQYGGYVIFGASFFHRSGKLASSTAVPGFPCNAFWDWWGRCTANSIALNGSFVHESLNEFGYNFGAGITRKLTGKYELYGEFRYEHGTRNNITTDFRPVTIGVRW
jgi:opacity protein-like surface antigen